MILSQEVFFVQMVSVGKKFDSSNLSFLLDPK